MRTARRLAAFVSGALLYSTVVIASAWVDKDFLLYELRGLLGNRPITSLVVAALTALVAFLLALAWSFITLKPQQGDRRLLSVWCFSGILSAWFVSLLVGVFWLALTPQHNLNMVNVLFVPGVPPLWGLLNTLAVAGGTLIAGLIARRALPPPRTRRLRA